MNKEYSLPKQKGNKGAAYLEYKLTDIALLHKIDESKDIGNDFLCELVDGVSPTRVLFFIQCKTWEEEPSLGKLRKDIGYWKGFDIPVYLFWLKPSENGKEPPYIVQYKRMTPYLHKGSRHKKEPFKNFDISRGLKSQFALDIFVDTMRCINRKGAVPGLDISKYDSTRILGKSYCAIFNSDLIREYRKEIKNNAWVGSYLLGGLFYSAGNDKSIQEARRCLQFSLSVMPKPDEKESFLISYARSRIYHILRRTDNVKQG